MYATMTMKLRDDTDDAKEDPPESEVIDAITAKRKLIKQLKEDVEEEEDAAEKASLKEDLKEAKEAYKEEFRKWRPRKKAGGEVPPPK